MTSREQFEAWHREKYKTKYSSGQPTRDMHNGKYAHCYTVAVEQERWEAWQASREALKPVAWAHRLINKHSGVAHPWVYGSAEKVCSEGDVFRVEVMPLYSNEED